MDRKEAENFQLSGPRHLTSVEWWDAMNRCSVASSLVMAVYVLEGDRQRRLHGDKDKGLAEEWWTFFNFELVQTMVDEVDGSIFAAVFKWSKKAANVKERPNGSPRTVIAFRGTDVSRETRARDFELDFDLVRSDLKTNCRYELGFDAVKRNVRKYGEDNVWISGHSLGAAMALLLGRQMVKEDCILEAHLFNPPFVAAPVERIANERIRLALQLVCFFIGTALAVILGNPCRLKAANNAFLDLAPWIPRIYVHPRDDISSSYIGFFRLLTKLQSIGIGEMANLVAQCSMSELLISCLCCVSEQPIHTIPSAKLNVNMTPAPDLLSAHKLSQWWDPHADIQHSTFIM